MRAIPPWERPSTRRGVSTKSRAPVTYRGEQMSQRELARRLHIDHTQMNKLVRRVGRDVTVAVDAVLSHRRGERHKRVWCIDRWYTIPQFAEHFGMTKKLSWQVVCRCGDDLSRYMEARLRRLSKQWCPRNRVRERSIRARARNLATQHDAPASLVYSRLLCGWTDDEAVYIPRAERENRGRTGRSRKIADRSGLNVRTVIWRLANGWTEDEAEKIPAYGRRKQWSNG